LGREAAGVAAAFSFCLHDNQTSVLFAGEANPGFHLIEILREGATAGGSEAIFGARNATFKKFHAGDVLRFFELASVNAEIAVSRFEYTLEIVEAEGIVGGECADDAETNALVNQAIELGKFGSAS